MAGDWILLPVRPLDDGKKRLAGVLSPTERIALNERLFTHVFAIASEVVGSERCIVVTRAPDLLARAAAAGALPLAEEVPGLNPGLTQAAAEAARRGATRTLALSCDLPFLSTADVAALLAGTAGVILAPDAARTGTNALLTCVAAPIPYRFGPDSRAAHHAEADANGLTLVEIRRGGLACDIDLPSDLYLLSTPSVCPSASMGVL